MKKKWLALGAGGIAAIVAAIPTIARRTMRITTILKRDHRMVSALFLSLETVGRAHTTLRRSIFEQIRIDLDAHSRAEEEVFYTALEHTAANSRMPLSRREHQEIRDLLRRIENLDPGSMEFMVKVRELKSQVQRHVNEEETTIFGLATEHMFEEELVELGREFSARKMELKRQRLAA